MHCVMFKKTPLTFAECIMKITNELVYKVKFPSKILK